MPRSARFSHRRLAQTRTSARQQPTEGDVNPSWVPIASSIAALVLFLTQGRTRCSLLHRLLLGVSCSPAYFCALILLLSPIRHQSWYLHPWAELLDRPVLQTRPVSQQLPVNSSRPPVPGAELGRTDTDLGAWGGPSSRSPPSS